MAYKTLIFGVDDMFRELQPFYAREVQRGTLEIVAYAVLENGKVNLVDVEGRPGGGILNFQLAIISSHNFYQRMKFLEAQGIPRNRIIDGRVFKIPNLDLPRLIEGSVAYGFFDPNSFPEAGYSNYTIYPRIYVTFDKKYKVSLGIKSYIELANLGVDPGEVIVGNFCSISGWENFQFDNSAGNPKYGHHYEYLGTYSLNHLDWESPFQDIASNPLKIIIGNDVWIGRRCTLKVPNSAKPLIIGDGAVIASDSVVVKNVPPYAIVGGNPAQIIKYRFPPHVIEALLRIKWWDWDIDKIYDNFKYFNDIEKFISLHDKEA